MANTFLNNLKTATNYTRTENGAITHKSTLNSLLDMFAMGGAYRNRCDEDVILLFKKALAEDEVHALKCLFYLRDVRGGQGERRFFKVCMKWLAKEQPKIARRNLESIPEYGRWDDLYVFIGTPLEKDALNFMKNQFALDLLSLEKPNQGVSLLGKWLKSCNASSRETKKLGNITRVAFGMTQKEYRKTLAELRDRINIVEKLMSENRWDEIEFDKIPSKAGLIYKNAFARRDIIAQKYEAFANDKSTTVNAKTLYPQEIATKAFHNFDSYPSVNRAMLQKYWDNLPNYYGDREENGIAVVDVSGSMYGTPLAAAVSLGAYIADKAHGPFANHFITFSADPKLVQFSGVDIVEKFNRCSSADWGMNTNIEKVFDLLLSTALKNKTPQKDMPERLYIFSDMEFDECITSERSSDCSWHNRNNHLDRNGIDTLIETISKKWLSYGYKMPSIVFWNLDARQNNIPAIGDGFSYVSGFAPVMIEQILSGKDGIALMLEKLDSERYTAIK